MPAEADHQPEDRELRERLQPPRYFENMSIRELYGDFRILPGTEIVTDIPLNPPPDQFPNKEQIEEIEKRYNLTGRGSMSNYDLFSQSHEYLVIGTSLEHGKTEWAGLSYERKLLLDLAHTLSPAKQPLVIDAACGNGFLAKLLAHSSDVHVVGASLDRSRQGELPETGGMVQLAERNIYDMIQEFGPDRADEMEESLRILQALREQYCADSGGVYIVNKGTPQHHQWTLELEALYKKMQELTKPHTNSPVDMLICNYMEADMDVTPLIRDGIYPKSLVYVKEHFNPFTSHQNSDYYAFQDAGGTKPDEITAFDPGINYRTVARWDTFVRDNWEEYAYSHSAERHSAEVVIQLRNDVVIEDLEDRKYPSCVWDYEIRHMMWANPFKEYVGDIEQARANIVRK